MERMGDFESERPSRESDYYWDNTDFSRRLRYSMAGKKGAANLGLRNAADAEQMEKDGASREDIWRKTGWWRARDGKWRVEIPDVKPSRGVVLNARTRRFKDAGGYYFAFRLEELVDGGEIGKAYPGLLGDIAVRFRHDMPSYKASYTPESMTIELSDRHMRKADAHADETAISLSPEARSLIVHELQHAIQQREGFAVGADADKFDLTEYVNTSGEVEARNVQARLAMTPEARAAIPPWETEDVPENRQIVRFSRAVRPSALGDGRQRYYEVKFEDAVDKIVKNRKPVSDEHVFISETPDVFKDIGMPALPVMMNQQHVISCYFGKNEGVKGGNMHGLGDKLKLLPRALQNPMMIIANDSNPSSSVIAIVKMQDRSGHTVITPVEINGIGRSYEGPITANVVKSAFGKRNIWSEKVARALRDEVDGKVAVFYVNSNEARGIESRLAREAFDFGKSERQLLSVAKGTVHSIADFGSPVKGVGAQKDSQQFKRWFTDSKVVDENGEPLVVYRRDNEAFNVFDVNKTQQNDAGWLGKGFYFYGDRREAESATGYGQNLREFYLKAENPYYITPEEYNRLVEADDPRVSAEFTERLREEGYDSVYWNGDGRKEWMVLEPTQIKSATDNIGTFDPGNPDIRYSRSGIFTGSAADYANRSRQGGVDDGPSVKKIGTGEGTQVYGWGLYGSTVRSVAEHYANRRNLIEDLADAVLGKASGSNEIALDDLRADKRLPREDRFLKMSDEEIDIVEKYIKGEDISKYEMGNLYEQTFFTNRAEGDESHLLKWYEPVTSEQKQWIADELNKSIDDAKMKWVVTENGLTRNNPYAIEEKFKTGQEAYQFATIQAAVLAKSKNGREYPKLASEFLYRAGIDGIKYPVDSYGGKGVKDGDEAGWNYVAFSDEHIRVDHKWTDGQMRYAHAVRPSAPGDGKQRYCEAKFLHAAGNVVRIL